VNTTKVEIHKRKVRLKNRQAVYYTLRWYTPSGRRCSQSLKGVTTTAEAKAAKLTKEAKLATGQELVERPDRMTVEDLIAYHLEVIQGEVGPRTALGYQHSAAHIKHAIGADRMIDKLSRADAGRLKTYLKTERKLRQATVDKVVNHLRAMLNVAVRDGKLARNPLLDMKTKGSPAKRARIYTLAEVRSMIDAAPSDWWRVYLRLAFSSGLREGELLNLKWEDIDGEAMEIRVQAKDGGTITHGGQSYPLLQWSAKSLTSYRTVPIPDDAVAMVNAYRDCSDGSPYLFLSLNRLKRIGAKTAGGSWKVDAKLVNNLLRDFHHIHRAAGLGDPVGTIHDLRKSYGTHMASKIPMHTLQAFMGHANISTTAKFYCRVTKEDEDKARAAMRDDKPDLRLVG